MTMEAFLPASFCSLGNGAVVVELARNVDAIVERWAYGVGRWGRGRRRVSAGGVEGEGEGGGPNNGVKLAIIAETNRLINTLFNWRLLA